MKVERYGFCAIVVMEDACDIYIYIIIYTFRKKKLRRIEFYYFNHFIIHMHTQSTIKTIVFFLHFIFFFKICEILHFGVKKIELYMHRCVHTYLLFYIPMCGFFFHIIFFACFCYNSSFEHLLLFRLKFKHCCLLHLNVRFFYNNMLKQHSLVFFFPFILLVCLLTVLFILLSLNIHLYIIMFFLHLYILLLGIIIKLKSLREYVVFSLRLILLLHSFLSFGLLFFRN